VLTLSGVVGMRWQERSGSWSADDARGAGGICQYQQLPHVVLAIWRVVFNVMTSCFVESRL